MPKMPDNKDGHVLNATLLLYNADQWTDEGRKEMARWLRRQAKDLVKDGHNYAPKFRARRFSVPEKVQDEREVTEEGLVREDSFVKSSQQHSLAVSDYAAGQTLKVQRGGG